MEPKSHTSGTAFTKSAQHGFTLIEVMMAMALTTIIVAAVFVAYTTQQRTYLAQEQVAEMQQNIRAAVDILSREIRTAGFDPSGKAGATIEIANPGHIQFTKDINEDEDHDDLGEMIDFGFSATAGNDADRDGIPDNPGDVLPLGRQTYDFTTTPPTLSGYQPLVENIQAIEFLYLDENDAVTAIPADVRYIRISLLARAGRSDRNFDNNMTYTAASGATWGPYNDNFRRRLLVTTVQCRNMGL